MSEANGATPPNPYVGPRPMQTGERLYGRDRERRELRDLLIARRIVVIYSPSGAGKTSLIQAGLVPELREADFHVLPVIRVNQPPLAETEEAANRYVISAIQALDTGLPLSQQTHPRALAKLTLPEYLARRPQESDSPLSDALIFDQFEEILTLDPTDQEAKRAFFAQVGEVLRDGTRWALFSLREDHLAALDPYLAAIPTRLAASFRLDLLGPEAAGQAMQRPALAAGVEFTNDAAQQLIDDLRRVRVQATDGSMEERVGPYVEPVQLQVVCQRLWEHLAEGKGAIDAALVARFGDVEGSLRSFYADAVAAVATETGVPEREIRDWFDERLITKHGVRGQVLWEPDASEGLQNEAIDELVDRHLVRRESRRGALFFELAHDRLIGPIRANNDAWYQVNLSAMQRQARIWNSQGRIPGYLLTGDALVQAEQWAADHQGELTALERAFLHDCQEHRALQAAEQREHELAAAQLLAREAQARQLAEESARQEAERRVVEQTRSTRRSRFLSAAAVAAALIALFFMWRAGEREQAADDQRATAQAETARAEGLLSRTTSLLRTVQSQSEPTPETALLLAVDALSAGDTPDARRALLQQIWRVPAASRVWPDPVVTLMAGEGRVRGLAFSPDLQHLATGDEAGGVILWRSASAGSWVEPSIRATGNAGGAVRALAFAPNGSAMVTAGDGGVRILDPFSLAPREELSDKAASSAAFSPKSDILVFAGADGTIERYVLASDERTVLRDPAVDGAIAVNALAVSIQGWIAAGMDDGSIQLWNPAGGRQSIPVPAGARNLEGAAAATGSIRSVTFDWTGTRLAAGDDTGMIWLIPTPPSSQQPVALQQGDVALTSIAFSVSGATLAAADESGLVALWDVEGEERLDDLGVLHGEGAWSVAFSPDLTVLASGGGDGDVAIWSQVRLALAVGEPLALGIPGPRVVAVDAASARIAVGGNDGAIQVCDLDSRPLTCQIAATGIERLRALALSTERGLLATADSAGSIAIRGLDDDRVVRRLAAESSVVSLALRDRDAMLVAGIVDFVKTGEVTAPSPGAIKNWPLGSLPEDDGGGTPVSAPMVDPATLPVAEIGPVRALAFDPEGRWLAAGGDGGIAWTTVADPPIIHTRKEARDTLSIAFSSDGREVVTGTGDGSIYLWDTANAGIRPSVLARLKAPVVGLGWSGSGALLAIDAQGLVIELNLATSILQARACDVVDRDFTAEESRRLFGEESHQACPTAES